MAKFKKGDRVINLKEEILIAKGAIGTVESEDTCPLVKWDEVKVSAKDDNYWFQNEEDLKLYDGQPLGISSTVKPNIKFKNHPEWWID